MFRFAGMGLVGAISLGVWLFAIFDAIATDSALVRNLPKVTWVFIVFLFGPVGAIAWLGFGRPMYAGWSPGATNYSQRPSRAVGYEDSSDWSRARPPLAAAPGPTPEELDERDRRLREWERELRRREDGLRDEAD